MSITQFSYTVLSVIQGSATFKVFEDTENVRHAKPVVLDENKRPTRAAKRPNQSQGVLTNLSNALVSQPPVATQFGRFSCELV